MSLSLFYVITGRLCEMLGMICAIGIQGTNAEILPEGISARFLRKLKDEPIDFLTGIVLSFYYAVRNIFKNLLCGFLPTVWIA